MSLRQLALFPMAKKAKTKKTQVLSARVGGSLGEQFAECVDRLGYLNPSEAVRDAVRNWVAENRARKVA